MPIRRFSTKEFAETICAVLALRDRKFDATANSALSVRNFECFFRRFRATEFVDESHRECWINHRA
jgi:hypothetical protein